MQPLPSDNLLHPKAGFPRARSAEKTWNPSTDNIGPVEERPNKLLLVQLPSRRAAGTSSELDV